MRVVRFILGVIILIQSIISLEPLMIVLGIVLTLMPVLNLGGCASGQCVFPESKFKKQIESMNVEFEEIKKSN